MAAPASQAASARRGKPPMRPAHPRSIGTPVAVVPSAVLPRAMSSTAPWPSSSDGGALTLRSCASTATAARQTAAVSIGDAPPDTPAHTPAARPSQPKARAADRRCAPEHQAAIPGQRPGGAEGVRRGLRLPGEVPVERRGEAERGGEPRRQAAAGRGRAIGAGAGGGRVGGKSREHVGTGRAAGRQEAGTGTLRVRVGGRGWRDARRGQLQHELDAAVRGLRRHLHPALGAPGQIAGGRDLPRRHLHLDPGARRSRGSS